MASFICGSAKGMAGSGLPGHPGHQRGARVALQRCPILRLVRLKCIQMPKLMPKTSQKTPQKTLDTTSALIDERNVDGCRGAEPSSLAAKMSCTRCHHPGRIFMDSPLFPDSSRGSSGGAATL